MKSTFRKVLTSVGAIALAGGALVATSGSALATPAPYYPDAGATLGGLDFFNAAGVQITSGSTSDSPFVGFAVAQTAPSGGGIKAAYYAYTPVNGSAPGTWGGAQLGGGTNYPISTPTDLAGLTNPIVTGVSGDTSIASYITGHPNTDTSTTDGYAGLYAIRAKVTGQPGYATADILVSGTTWTQVDGTFQLFSDTTTTTLTPSPASPSVPGTVETLTATVADTTSGSTNVPAGTVAFFDGTTQVGTTQTLASGSAHVTTTLALGSHPLTAVFTSSSPSTVAGSTSAVSTYVVAPLDSTNTALSVNPTTAAAFTPVDLLATVTDTTTPATIPTGSVNFLDGTTTIGTAPVNGSGVAEIPTYSGFAQGSHSITAVFSPTGSTVAGSTSAAVTFTATAPACPNGEAANLCTDPQTVEATVAAGTITITTPYSPSNPLSLGTLVLNSAGTQLSASAPFGSTVGHSSPTSTDNEIFVTDTRAGDANWTASVQSGNFTSPSSPTTPIDGQNAGLTGLTVEPVSGNALTAANVTVTNNQRGVAPIIAGGTQGIGGAKHTFAQTTAGGDGSIGFIGTFTLNAPTSTGAGLYTGTVTFTVG
jgi:Bacterial Ig-like domain (group 3)